MSLPAKPHELVEPFAGGGIVSLTAVAEGLVERVTMIELDHVVASVWETIFSGDYQWLADRIVEFEFTEHSVREELAKTGLEGRELAFQTILKNRVYHGGILAPGSGLLKYGENGKGLRSRWYPQTLRKRILNAARFKDSVRFVEGDGVQMLQEYLHQPEVVSFIDPPYTAGKKGAGTRLYTHSELDHEQLFRTVSSLAGDFLMTYDNDERVRVLANRNGFDIVTVPMKGTHHAEMTELLIGRDMSWSK
jgi:DNA adenine methylase